MKVENYQFPKSSFLSVEKDMCIIVEQMSKNDRLKKLLYYTTPDALKRGNVSEEQWVEMFGKQIKIVPKFTVDGEILNYIVIKFTDFIPSGNPEFRNNIVEFDIICHVDQWNLGDYQLRPYRIAAEIDTLFNKRHLTGIGILNFIGANQVVLNDEFSGLCLMYEAVHGEDDKIFAPSEEEDRDIKENFDKIFNQ